MVSVVPRAGGAGGVSRDFHPDAERENRASEPGGARTGHPDEAHPSLGSDLGQRPGLRRRIGAARIAPPLSRRRLRSPRADALRQSPGLHARGDLPEVRPQLLQPVRRRAAQDPAAPLSRVQRSLRRARRPPERNAALAEAEGDPPLSHRRERLDRHPPSRSSRSGSPARRSTFLP